MGAAIEDAIAQDDLVGIDLEVERRNRTECRAEADRARTLGPERGGAEQLGTGRIGRQFAGRPRCSDRGGGVVLLGQRGCADAGRVCAAQRKGRGDVVARRHLARPGAAEVRVAFPARGAIDLPGLGQVQPGIAIKREDVARPCPGAGRQHPGHRLRAAVDGGSDVTGAFMEHLTAVLAAQRQVQRAEHRHRDRPVEIDIVGPLEVAHVLQVERGRRRPGLGIERGVGRIPHVVADQVLADRAAGIPVEPDQVVAAQAGRHRIVVLGRAQHRREAVRIDRRQDRGQAIDLIVVGGAVRVSRGGIGIDAAGELVVAVQRDIDAVAGGIAEPVAVVDAGAAVGAGAVGAGVVLIADREIDPAPIAELPAIVAVDVLGEAVTGGIGARLRGDIAAGRVLEDDVDDAGNRVRAVLCRGAVAQHLDARDRRRRDQADVDRGSAAEWAGIGEDVGGGVAALAVDQHQRLVGAEAAQVDGIGQRRDGGALRLAVGAREELNDGVAQVVLAGGGERGAADDIDRAQALAGGDAGLAGAGDDDVAAGRRVALRVGLCRAHDACQRGEREEAYDLTAAR